MPFPNFVDKHANDAFFHPRDLIDYLRKKQALPEITPPQGMIFCYQKSLFRQILSQEETEPISVGATEFHVLKQIGDRIAICGDFGIGAPAVSMVLETCVALGVRKFISIGMAGALQETTKIGDIIVCKRAIRDEGVSHHYLEPAKYSYPSLELTHLLYKRLVESNAQPTMGTTWTIDTPYRETVEEAHLYQSEGVSTVEMEAAALFAVAQYRGVELAAAFVISDSLAELTWNPQFGSELVTAGLFKLYQSAIAALT